MFNDYYKTLNIGEQDYPTIQSGDFFRELLCSYRLLFGQDKASRRVFEKDFRDRSYPEQEALEPDPLLLPLCQEDWSRQLVYEELDVSNVRTVYSATIDFPFFMERLMNLQEYVITQSPNDWSSLWRDRRDLPRFWGLFAVLLFGAASILLALVQIALAGVQVGGTFLPHSQ